VVLHVVRQRSETEVRTPIDTCRKLKLKRAGVGHTSVHTTGKRGSRDTLGTHGTRGRTKAHRPHRRTSQPSKPTSNTHPARQRDDRSRGRLNSRRPGADRCTAPRVLYQSSPGSPRCLFTGSDSGSRAWGSGACARCVEQQQQQRKPSARASAGGMLGSCYSRVIYSFTGKKTPGGAGNSFTVGCDGCRIHTPWAGLSLRF